MISILSINSYLNLPISTSGRQPRLCRMPIARVHRSTVGRKLQLTLVRTLQIPQLNGSVLRNGRKQIRILRTELHITNRLGIGAKRMDRFVRAHIEAFDGTVLGAGYQQIGLGTVESDLAISGSN